jgi:hypothetical protein
MNPGTWKRARQPHRTSVAVALAISLVTANSSCVPPMQRPGRFTGALPRPLDQMTNREFAQFVAQLRWSDTTVATRRCDTTGVDGARCRGDRWTDSTLARILSEWTAHGVGRRDSPPNGAVVWKLNNLGGRTENRYRLRPGPNVSYYLVVFPPALLRRYATWRMVEVDSERLPTRGEERVATHMRGEYYRCNDHPHHYGRKHVGFAWCEENDPRRFRRMFAPTPTVGLEVGIIDSPGWGDCSSGCCTGGR